MTCQGIVNQLGNIYISHFIFTFRIIQLLSGARGHRAHAPLINLMRSDG